MTKKINYRSVAIYRACSELNRIGMYAVPVVHGPAFLDILVVDPETYATWTLQVCTNTQMTSNKSRFWLIGKEGAYNKNIHQNAFVFVNGAGTEAPLHYVVPMVYARAGMRVRGGLMEYFPQEQFDLFLDGWKILKPQDYA